MSAFRKKTRLFLAATGLLVAALTLVSRSTRPPTLPPEVTHRDLRNNGDCAPCHAEGAEATLHRQHPPKDDCLRCHRRPEKRA